MLKQTTMRVNTATQRALVNNIANCMNDKTPWRLDGNEWLITHFRPIEHTNQITVYMEKFKR